MYSQPVGIVGGVEAAADVAFVRPLARILPEGIVEMREVRQVRHVGHQALDPRIECLADVAAALRQALVDLAADLHQHADQVGDVAARVVDVGLQQNGISRGLVELDVVALCQQSLELRAVEAGGAANQRHARRIEAELVLSHAATRHRPVGLRDRGSR